MYFFIGLKCGNSKWAVKVVWVRYLLLSLVRLAAVLVNNTSSFLLICRNEGRLQNCLKISVLLTDLLLTVANLFEPSVDGKSDCSLVIFLFSPLRFFSRCFRNKSPNRGLERYYQSTSIYLLFIYTYLRMSTPSTVRFLGRRICCISMAIRVRNILAFFKLPCSSADCHTMQAIAGTFGHL
jgi:hypothetical protein